MGKELILRTQIRNKQKKNYKRSRIKTLQFYTALHSQALEHLTLKLI